MSIVHTPIELTMNCDAGWPGWWYIQLYWGGGIGLTSHPNDGAIGVNFLAQGHNRGFKVYFRLPDIQGFVPFTDITDNLKYNDFVHFHVNIGASGIRTRDLCMPAYAFVSAP